MTFLRFIRLLSLTLWIGSILLLRRRGGADSLRRAAHATRWPDMVVSRSLSTLHWIGLRLRPGLSARSAS